MKARLLPLTAVALLLVSSTAYGVTEEDYQEILPYCENWEGTWSIVSNHGTDNVTFGPVCKRDESCLKRPDIMDCQSVGKRASDNHTIMIGLFSFTYEFFGYYEFDKPWDNVTINQNTPADSIPVSSTNLDCGRFSGGIGVDAKDDFGLVSGKKSGSPDCALQRIIPGRISKATALLMPLKVFTIIGSGDPAFAADDEADFDSAAVTPLVQLRVSPKLILAVCFVKPAELEEGEIAVTVNCCQGAITVK